VSRVKLVATKNQNLGTYQDLSGHRNNQELVTAEKILTLFETLGLRNTRTRRLIAEQLEKFAVNGIDFTVQELWQELRDLALQIGRVTVYRTVEVLVDKGLIYSVSFVGGCYRYRLNSGSSHYQVRCTQCQRVFEVMVGLPPELITTVKAATDFVLEGYSLELFGRCANCCAKLKELLPANVSRKSLDL